MKYLTTFTICLAIIATFLFTGCDNESITNQYNAPPLN
jgi:outer membrane murein-binding lipoprotein Lpp